MKHFINLEDIPAQDLRKILIDAKNGGMEVVPSKNGINLWKKLRKESG